MGFMFERVVGFKFTDGLIVKAKLSTADAKDAPYEFEIPRMSSPTNRYKSEESTPLGNNQLWLTPTNFCSFDYIGICEVPEIGKVLLAVSCTIQKEGNSSKVSSMALMPLLRKLALTQCNGNVIVLYINPEMTNSFDNLFLSFQTISPQSTRNNPGGELHYYFALPRDCTKFREAFNRIRILLAP